MVNGKTPSRQLSSEVLKLRLQALHLPVAGSRATLIAALRKAQSVDNSRPAAPKPAGRVSKRNKRAPGRPARTKRTVQVVQPPQAPQSDEDEIDARSLHPDSENEDALSDAGSSAEDLLQQRDPALVANSGFNGETPSKALFKRP